MNNSRRSLTNGQPDRGPQAQAPAAPRRSVSVQVPEASPSARFNAAAQAIPIPGGVPLDVIGPLVRTLNTEIPQIIATAQELDPTAAAVKFRAPALLGVLARALQLGRGSFVREVTSSAATLKRIAYSTAQERVPTGGFFNVAERARAVDDAAAEIVVKEVNSMVLAFTEKKTAAYEAQAQSVVDAIDADRKSVAIYRIRSARPAVSLIAAIDPAIVAQLPALTNEYLSQGWAEIYENATRMIATFGAGYVSELPWLQYEAALRREAATIARSQVSVTPGQLGRAGEHTKEIQHATWLSNAFTRAAELRAGDGAARLLDLVLAKTTEAFRLLAGEDFSDMNADQISRSMRQSGAGTLDGYLNSTKIEKGFVERFCVRVAPITLSPWSPTGVTKLDKVLLTGISPGNK